MELTIIDLWLALALLIPAQRSQSQLQLFSKLPCMTFSENFFSDFNILRLAGFIGKFSLSYLEKNEKYDLINVKKKCFGLIVALVPTIHKARSIHTMAKWPFINILVSKLTIFDPLPLLLAGRRSLPERIYNPVMTLGFRKCLPVSWTTLRGKHFWHPIAVMEVVDTFAPSVLICILGYPSPPLKHHL